MYFNERSMFCWGPDNFYRGPSVVCTNDGTVFLFASERRKISMDYSPEQAHAVRRKKSGGEWEEHRLIAAIPGWGCGTGSAVYDHISDTVMVASKRIPAVMDEFGSYTEQDYAEFERITREKEKEAGTVRGWRLMYTEDNGDTWNERMLTPEENTLVHTDGREFKIGGETHGSAHGIVLRHGKYAGRIVCPSRTYAGRYTKEELHEKLYNNCIYSDDRGVTWKASKCVQPGTGEGTLIERGDGTLLYNSRAYFKDGRRRMAISRDGGETWGEFYNDEFLFEDTNQGCNAAFLRIERSDIKDADKYLPDGCEAITLFANPRNEKRATLTVCISFDDGATWSRTKTVWERGSAYCSLDFNKIDQHLYLAHERGGGSPYNMGIHMCEFDLEWLMNEI